MARTRWAARGRRGSDIVGSDRADGDRKRAPRAGSSCRGGSGFDASRDARPLAGESRAQFDAFLAIWAKIELEDLPGFFYWQRSAFDMLHDHLRDLGGIFFEYCKRGAAGAKSIAEAFTMSSREWAAFCKECKVPVPISELNDTFRRVDRAEKGAKAGTKSDKQLVLGEFIEAIVRLAVKMMLMSAAGRKAVKGATATTRRRPTCFSPAASIRCSRSTC